MPKLLEGVVTGGDRMKSLEALRDKLANAIDLCESARDIAALSARLTDVLTQIAELQPPKQKAGDPIDEVAARRANRRAGSSAS